MGTSGANRVLVNDTKFVQALSSFAAANPQFLWGGHFKSKGHKHQVVPGVGSVDVSELHHWEIRDISPYVSQITPVLKANNLPIPTPSRGTQWKLFPLYKALAQCEPGQQVASSGRKLASQQTAAGKVPTESGPAAAKRTLDSELPQELRSLEGQLGTMTSDTFASLGTAGLEKAIRGDVMKGGTEMEQTEKILQQIMSMLPSEEKGEAEVILKNLLQKVKGMASTASASGLPGQPPTRPIRPARPTRPTRPARPAVSESYIEQLKKLYE